MVEVMEKQGTRRPQMPAVFNGVNMQRVPRDAAEQTIFDQAFVEWCAANPPAHPVARWHRSCIVARLSGKPQPSLPAALSTELE